MSPQDSAVSWIGATGEALRLAKNADQAQRQVAALQEAKSNFDRLVTEFRQLAEAGSFLRNYGWAGRGGGPELTNALEESAQKLDSRPLSHLTRVLDRFAPDVKAALIEQWNQHAGERLGDVAELSALAATLGHVEGVAEISRRLQAVLGDLARMQGGVPSAQSVQKLQEAESVLQELEDSLKPEAVRRFLSAVARGGAALDLFSKDVADWLNSHRALRDFKIVAGSPSESTNV